MSEPVVHEMQLSGKQLFFLFMTALVILGGAFFLGVSVGQGVRSARATDADDAEPGIAAGGASTTPTPSPDLTFPNILQGKAGASTPPPPAAGGARAAEPPAPTPKTKVTPTPTPTPTPTKAPKATATPAPAKPVPPAGNSWFVQTDAFKSRENADKRVASLKAKGFPAFLVTSGGLFSVKVGPYPARAEANAAAKKLEAEGLTPRVTR